MLGINRDSQGRQELSPTHMTRNIDGGSYSRLCNNSSGRSSGTLSETPRKNTVKFQCFPEQALFHCKNSLPELPKDTFSFKKSLPEP